jgi:hypothetical protein
MGPSIDQRLTAWDESFLPEALAQWVGRVEVDGEPLVIEQRVIHASVPAMPVSRLSVAPLIPVTLGLMLATLMWGLIRTDGRVATWTWQSGALLAGTVGLVLLIMMLLSGHHDSRWNVFLLLLHPLWWLLLVARTARLQRMLAFCFGAAAATGSLILVWPGLIQDRPGLVVVVMPVLLVTLWGVSRQVHQPS